MGVTKADIEGKGKRRCFECRCEGNEDPLCPACALKVLIGEPAVAENIQSDRGMHTPSGGAMSAAGLVKTWAGMLTGCNKYNDLADTVAIEVTEHTPRRAGAQFHAGQGLQLWQVQYIGRWGSSTVEIYVGEAFADMRANWSRTSAAGIPHPRHLMQTASYVNC